MAWKTGRTVLCFLLTLAMVAGLVPGTSPTALADEQYLLWVGGEQVTSSNLSGEGWSYDPQRDVLRLDNYSDTGGHCITYGGETYHTSIFADQDLNIELVGTNNIIPNDDQAVPDAYVWLSIYTKYNLVISGNGELNLTHSCERGYALYCGRNLTIENSTVKVESAGTAIYAYKELTIKDSVVEASSAFSSSQQAICSEGGTVTINNSEVIASGYFGILTRNGLKMDGGTLDATNVSLIGFMAWNKKAAFEFSGGTAMFGNEQAEYGVGFERAGKIVISGGEVVACGKGQAVAMDDNGVLTLGEGVSVKAGESEADAVCVDDLDSWAHDEKWVRFGHLHDFVYSAAGGTITATCTEDRCTLPTVDGVPTATLTIEAPAADDGEAVVEASPEDAFGDLSGMVRYQTKTGATWGEETTVAPTAAGIHRASITLGDATASVSYGMNCIAYATGIANGGVAGPANATCGSTVTLAVTPDAGYQLDTLTVTPEAGSGVGDVVVDGNTFVMPEASVTVSATFRQITYSVAVDGGKATVTDSTPEQHAYTAEIMGMPEDKTYDGEPIDLSATVQKSDGFPSQIPVGDVSFKFRDQVVERALGVGTYTASAAVGDKTISKPFTIHGQIPAITYCSKMAIVDNYFQITLVVTNEYIPLASNPFGITLLMDGRTYVARGDIKIGALVVVGNPKLVLCDGANVTVYAGIYHIGSSLEIYNEKDAEDSVLTIEGSRLLSDLDNYNEVVQRYGAIAGEGSSLSGTIRINGGNVAAEKGVNGRLVADDFSLTHGPGVTAKGSKAGFELAKLTGGTEDGEGFVTYDSANLSELTKLVVEQKPPATVSTVPVARDLTYSGMAQELVTAGEASGGTMQYALGNADAAPAEGWGEGIPAAIGDGTYHVWYRAVGDADHIDSEPVCVEVAIGRAAWQDTDAVLLSANVTLSGRLEMNYYLSVPDAVASGARVVMDGPEGTVTQALSNLRQDDGRYMASYPVTAIRAYQPITLTLTDGQGGAVALHNSKGQRYEGDRRTFGLYDYFDAALGEGSQLDDGWKAKVRAIHTYCAYAAKWKYEVALPEGIDALPSDEAVKSAVGSHKATQTGTAPGTVRVTGASLLLDADTSLRLYFTCDDLEGEGHSFKLDGRGVEPELLASNESTSKYFVLAGSIGVGNLGKAHTITFGDGYTVSLDALSYVRSVLRDGDADQALRDLVKALYAYYAAFNG